MPVLNSSQRRLLEATVIKARKLAEKAAVKALQNLATDQPEPFTHMNPAERDLRRRLRAKARLLGDENTNGKQEIRKISYELAYEYWHKMLFACFLEANNLLIHPKHQISVSLDECAEFAADEGHADKWAAAAFYASHMLPAIFRPEDPLMQVEFATEDRLSLEQLLESLEPEMYTATDSLGWVYQYWQSEAKSEVLASEEKIDGSRLPAVTQLFTEPYMVHFLIDNTLGAWWTSRNPEKKPPIAFEYLRALEDGRPAAGSFDHWPENAKDITTLDPCMGSGHFMVELFLKLAPLRMLEEGLSKEEATGRVIAENLHGLEIDPRCTQIAAFNLALTAWKFCGNYLELPEMNLACSGIAPKGKVEDWVKLVTNVKPDDRGRMENGMKALYDHFQLAPELGSLLDPSTIKPDAFTASFDMLQPVLLKALETEQDQDIVERGVMAAGIAKAGQLLSRKYTLLITNVPYLGRGRQVENGIIANFCFDNYSEAKGDLATVFFDKMLKTSTGTACSVMPQNWLFLTTYKKFREKLLKNNTWSMVARLGPGAFSQISGEVVKAILASVHSVKPFDETHFSGLDVSDQANAAAKDDALKTAEVKMLKQKEQLGNPDARIVVEEVLQGISLLEKYANSVQGTMPSDRSRLVFNFWEYPLITSNEVYMHGSSTSEKTYNGMSQIFKLKLFEKIYKEIGGRFQGQKAWQKKGVVISIMSELPISLYTGEVFDGNVHAIVPLKPEYLPALYTYTLSSSFRQEIRKIDQKVSVTCATIVKIPFDYYYWQKTATEKYPKGLPKPYSNDPTQWLFHGHPKPSDNPLQVAVARMMGYRWPAESDEEMELDEKAREYIAQIKAFDHLTDEDGILCIPPVNGEKPAAEVLREYLREVWGSEWGNQTPNQLLHQEGSSKTSIEQWLREEFFAQHCKVFQNRPFIWHIWDGRKDGFAALVNYHKLDKANLQKLIYTYLNDWIRQCERKLKDGESGADGQLMAARSLKEKLELILAGEPPYDIFVRWKSLHEQPIGWEPDLNDGVRLNIYPFMQAGILRKNPNIKWGKDRGKNPAGSPWGPDRHNRYEDLEDKYKLMDENKRVIEHLTNEFKRIARETYK